MGQSLATLTIASLLESGSLPAPKLRERRVPGARVPVLGGRYGKPPEATRAEEPDTQLGCLENHYWNLHRLAKEEAQTMLSLVGARETVSSVRELIRVGEKAEKLLLAFIEKEPVEARWVLEAMRFRTLVLEEFNRLVESAEHAERVEAAEAEAARRAALVRPVLPMLHELVVPVSA